ncbi:phosphatase PAP2 family protein [Nocardioides aquiterrae]|uniref:Phosphatase PAP2 family protein n=1 Tax=Nocardioides aquiterrae TaxID=203799 RepID=A0ABP4F5Q8_9ACTN
MASNGVTVVGGRAEEAWFRAVNDVARSTPWLHTPARLYAEYGVVLFAGLLLVSWLLARRTGDLSRVTAALWAPAGALVAVGLNQLVAGAVAEQRPYAAMPGVLVLVSRSSDPSFPSDHAVMAGAVAAGVLLAHRRLGLLAAGLAVLMAATRVYVGAHFPLDVVAGLALGAAAAVASYLLLRPLLLRLVVLLARTPLRPLVTAQPVLS